MKLLNIDIESNIVCTNTNKNERHKILENFRKSEKINILLNVHILDEGS